MKNRLSREAIIMNNAVKISMLTVTERKARLEMQKKEKRDNKRVHDEFIGRGMNKVVLCLRNYKPEEIRTVCNKVARNISFKMSREKQIVKLKGELSTLEAKR